MASAPSDASASAPLHPKTVMGMLQRALTRPETQRITEPFAASASAPFDESAPKTGDGDAAATPAAEPTGPSTSPGAPST